MVNLIKTQLEELKEINRQRIAWLKISGFVALAILIIIIDWTYVKHTPWGWGVISLGLILSIVWWYWTMMVIRKLIDQKSLETASLIEIINDIKEIKKEVQENFKRSLDNIK